MDGELWKNIPGYEGLYRVSNFGRVKTLAKVSVGIFLQALKKERCHYKKGQYFLFSRDQYHNSIF
ncbi:NUMOD4 domain-containing protein [Taibaiella helva]|uniref:NUMOD4 domain-containing protein n=1 Tax=Taibaiella helva TaxID=2301235 RepID=UPI000E58A874